MYTFSNPHIGFAGDKDVTGIRLLLNSAYRGDSSKQGWTTETHLISGGQRTDEQTLQEVIQQSGSVFLKYISGDNDIIGCVNLQQHGDKLYLGMFAVSPHLQGAGIGKQLLQASEEYAKSLACRTVYMSVISVRAELIHWYQRHGYRDTGERKAFAEDGIHGKHLQPMEFMMLEKEV